MTTWSVIIPSHSNFHITFSEPTPHPQLLTNPLRKCRVSDEVSDWTRRGIISQLSVALNYTPIWRWNSKPPRGDSACNERLSDGRLDGWEAKGLVAERRQRRFSEPRLHPSAACVTQLRPSGLMPGIFTRLQRVWLCACRRCLGPMIIIRPFFSLKYWFLKWWRHIFSLFF